MVYSHTKTTARYDSCFCHSYIFFAFSPFLFELFNTGLIDIKNVKEIVRFLILSEKPPSITSVHSLRGPNLGFSGLTINCLLP